MKTYSPRLTSYTKKYKLNISEKSGNSEANKRKIRQYLEKGGKVMNALKKLGICLSAMVLAVGLAVTAPKSVEAGTSYYETTKITDIKEGAGSSYDRVIELPKDAVMKVTSKKNSKWYKVEYQNSKQKKFKGYVKAADLQKAIEYKVKKDAYIREKAKQSSDTVYIADKGEKLFVVNTSNKGWYKVVYYEDGDVYRGYASSAKLKKISKDTSSDKKDAKKQQDGILQVSNVTATSLVEKPDVPLAFALLPVLPLALLIFFSPFVGLFQPTVTLGTTTAMLFSLFLSLVFVLFHTRSVRTTFNVFASFWKGMGNVFTSVVTLIVASEVFSKGLIGLGFIDSLVGYSSHIGLSGLAIAAIFTLIIFGAAMLMGSGNAAFFSFGPLLPGIATQLGLPVFSLILPLQLAASMGRAASPIAGVIVAIAGVAGVSSVELARRNTFPLIGGIVFLILYHLITF